MSLLSLIVVSAIITAPLKDSPSSALKDLQGVWQAKSIEERGEPFNEAQVQETTIEIEGDVLVRREGESVERFRIKLIEPDQKPAKMDLTLIAEGVDPRKACHLIFEVGKDSLKLCLPRNFAASKPEERPTEFTTGGKRPPQGKLLFVLERIKK
jgi:uncharacterized protein (TIGR03067 family)